MGTTISNPTAAGFHSVKIEKAKVCIDEHMNCFSICMRNRYDDHVHVNIFLPEHDGLAEKFAEAINAVIQANRQSLNIVPEKQDA